MQDKSPLISVVIPTYNRSAFITLAIDSVMNQTFTNYEIIVVDDGSTDGTKDIVKKYGDRIRYLYQGNSGVSAARNCGIHAAQGEWVAFLDSDDEWLPSYLGKHSELLVQYPSIVGSVMNSVAEALDGQKTDSFEERKLYQLLQGRGDMLVPHPFRVVTDHHVTTLQSCAFRRDVLLSTRLFDEDITIAEDWDIVAQMAIKGSFALCAEIHARVIRRQEEVVNLSSQFVQHGIRTRLAWARVFNRFLHGEDLSAEERMALRRKFASNQRALGNLQRRAGAIYDARKTYQHAWSLDQSLKSLGRLALSYVPEGFSQAFFTRSGRFGQFLPGEVGDEFRDSKIHYPDQQK